MEMIEVGSLKVSRFKEKCGRRVYLILGRLFFGFFLISFEVSVYFKCCLGYVSC